MLLYTLNHLDVKQSEVFSPHCSRISMEWAGGSGGVAAMAQSQWLMMKGGMYVILQRKRTECYKGTPTDSRGKNAARGIHDYKYTFS